MSKYFKQHNEQDDGFNESCYGRLSALIDIKFEKQTSLMLQEMQKLWQRSPTPFAISEEETEELPMDLKQGAELLGIALSTMYAKVARREFTSYRKGKKVYVFKSQLLEYLKSGKRKSAEEIKNVNHSR